MADKPKSIIIKRPKKGHGAAHGGSWKVAYADFVTAMMAFFLLMWLLSMTSSEKKAALSQYFKNYSLFETGGKAFMDKSADMFSPQGNKEFTEEEEEEGQGAAKDPSKALQRNMDPNSSEYIKEKLKKDVELKLQTLKDQVLVDIFEGGVRIQIIDNEGSSMFAVGSTQPNEKALEILRLVAQNIKDSPHKVAVEGHTDSLPYTGGAMTNWELSAGRASMARKVLEDNGVAPGKIARVVGYADTEPLIEQNTRDPRNRRISIILFSKKPGGTVPKTVNDLPLPHDLSDTVPPPSARHREAEEAQSHR